MRALRTKFEKVRRGTICLPGIILMKIGQKGVRSRWKRKLATGARQMDWSSADNKG